MATLREKFDAYSLPLLLPMARLGDAWETVARPPVTND